MREHISVGRNVSSGYRRRDSSDRYSGPTWATKTFRFHRSYINRFYLIRPPSNGRPLRETRDGLWRAVTDIFETDAVNNVPSVPRTRAQISSRRRGKRTGITQRGRTGHGFGGVRSLFVPRLPSNSSRSSEPDVENTRAPSAVGDSKSSRDR